MQKASWKKTVALAALFGALYALINRSAIGVAGLLRITGGASILDFEFGYGYEKAYGMLLALGPEGRAFYLTRILPLDFLFPISYMLSYASLIALLAKYANPPKPCRYLLLVPVLAMLCDWAENIGAVAMLNGYPGLPRWAVPLASISGMLKTASNVGCLAAIAGLSILFALSKLRKARTA